MEQRGRQPNQPAADVVREVVRFGPFEADLKAGELRKRGLKVKLQELPFRLLAALLERPGEVVTREELQAKLWPGGTFVDFESGLGTALKKVREGLDDSASTPCFIETIPRRGYRFIAEVQKSDVQRDEVEKIGIAQPAATAPQMRPAWNNPVAALIAGAVVIGLVSGAAYSRFRTRPMPLTDQDVLVLADFTNTTGDAAFDGALRQALAFDLEGSPFLKIMDDEEVNQALKLMGRKAGEPITNDVAHEVCVREGQKATIGGSIGSLGKTYAIALLATNCQTGATLAREQAEAEDKEHVLKAVAKAATGMRAKLGESLSSIQKTERMVDFTTNSLEALNAFQLGLEVLTQVSSREAIPQLRRATELDPNFATAHMLLGDAYGNTGQSVPAAESRSRAFVLIDRVSERERLMIAGEYYGHVANDLNKATDAYEMLVRSYPRFEVGHHTLGQLYSGKGEFERALEQHQQSAGSAPRNRIFQVTLMYDYITLDRFDEAKAVAERFLAQKLDGPSIHQLLLQIAYIQDDQAAQEKEIQWFAGKPEEYQGLVEQATNARVHGQRRKARDLYQQAAEVRQRQALPNIQLGPPAATIDAFVGDCEAALKEKTPLALLICGDPAALKAADEQDAKNPPPNPDMAALLYRHGEFQKILDHKGRNWGPYYSLAYLGLARASVKAGETAKAKHAYQDFLALWKDADADAPYLIQAKKELADLH